MTTKAVVIVPSRGRPGNLARLAAAFDATRSGAAELLAVVDDDDPALPEYRGVDLRGGRLLELAEPRRIGPILNSVAKVMAREYEAVGFMGDDHLPRTDGWDQRLVEELDSGPGVSYGNDQVQGERLPTAVMISAVLIRRLGYMCPPGLIHLFLDDFWKRLGQDVGCLVYLPGVVIQHLHPIAGTAERDAGYEFTLDPALFAAEERRYQEFLATRWPSDLAMLRESL